MAKMAKTLHLHWAYRLPPSRTELNISKAIGVCASKQLKPDEWTREISECTCAKCLEIAHRAPELPKPSDALPAASISTAKMAPKDSKGKWNYPPGAHLEVIGDNPKEPGTPIYQRWQQVWDCNRKPWESFRDAGGNPTTLQNAIKAKKVRLI